METSPLIYLDYNVSQMLCEQVRLSQEEESRRYHSELFENDMDKNRNNHYLISNIFNDIRKGHSWYDPWPAYIHWGPKGLWETIISNKYYFNVSRCNKHYERILQDYIDNTNLQRCHGRCR